MANLSLATLAARRATDGVGPQAAGYCQMWVRLTVQALYGSRWDRWLWKPSAAEAGLAFLAAARAGQLSEGAVALDGTRASETAVGDVLYRTVGDSFGHVMIRVLGNRVAENSSVHHGPHGAVGFRPLEAVRFDTIVRLPDPAEARPPERMVVLPEGQVAPYTLTAGQAVVDLRPLAEGLGYQLDTADWPQIVVRPRDGH